MEQRFKLFSVRDNVSQTFERPELAISKEVYLRSLKYLVNHHPEFAMKKNNAKDFDIFCVGEFDMHTGLIYSIDKELVCSMLDCLEEKCQ